MGEHLHLLEQQIETRGDWNVDPFGFESVFQGVFGGETAQDGYGQAHHFANLVQHKALTFDGNLDKFYILHDERFAANELGDVALAAGILRIPSRREIVIIPSA